jgi:hypothetical protein
LYLRLNEATRSQDFYVTFEVVTLGSVKSSEGVNAASYKLLTCTWKERWASVLGIATRYGPDGPGIEARSGQDFPQPSRLALPDFFTNGYLVIAGGKAAGT